MNGEQVIRPSSPDRVRLVQITDTHILGRPGETFGGVDTAATLSAVVEAVNRLETAPDAILLTGDLVQDPVAAAYERLLDGLAPLQAPIFCIAGNHDEPELMHACMNRDGVHTADSLQLGAWRLLLLNTWMPGSHAGRLSRQSLRFLREQLVDGTENHVLIALHHPPVKVASTWMDAMGLENAEEFLSLLDEYTAVRAVLWGHIHQEYDGLRGGIRLLGTPSTCIQFRPGADRYAVDDRPPAFRCLSLYRDGTVATQLHYIDRRR